MSYDGGDRIKETSSTSGTGSFLLSGAVSGEGVRALAAGDDGKLFRYFAKHTTADEAEVGFGVYTHSTRTLTRQYRYYPTAGGGPVTFSAGGLFVGVTPTAADVLPFISNVDPTESDDINAGFLRGQIWINPTTPAVWMLRDHGGGSPSVADWVRIDTGGGGELVTSGTITAGDWARFTDSATVQGISDAELVAQIDALFAGAVSNWRGEGDEAASIAFSAKADTSAIPTGQLASLNEADLPGTVGVFIPGQGSQRMDAAFSALLGTAGLSQVDDAGTAVTIGSATNGTLRFLLSDSAVTVTIAAALPQGARIVIIKAGAGTVTVQCQAAQSTGSGAGYFVAGDDHGDTKSTTSFTVDGWAEFRCRSNSDGDSAVVVVDGQGLSLPTTLSAPVTGAIDLGDAGIEVPNGSAVSGTLTKAAHGGGIYETSGNCTITPAPGFTVTLYLDGARTIGAGGVAHTGAAGDAVTVVCFGDASNGKIKLFQTLAADVVNLPTS